MGGNWMTSESSLDDLLKDVAALLLVEVVIDWF